MAYHNIRQEHSNLASYLASTFTTILESIYSPECGVDVSYFDAQGRQINNPYSEKPERFTIIIRKGLHLYADDNLIDNPMVLASIDLTGNGIIFKQTDYHINEPNSLTLALTNIINSILDNLNDLKEKFAHELEGNFSSYQISILERHTAAFKYRYWTTYGI